MNAICLFGSPRKNGNSDRLANRICNHAETKGVTVEKHHLVDLEMSGFVHRDPSIDEFDHLAIKDDLTPVLDSVFSAEVLILATPIYWTDVSAQLKMFIDRCYAFLKPDFLDLPLTEKSRFFPRGRTLIFVQAQGEGEEVYGELLYRKSGGFVAMGYDTQHLVRAWDVRKPDAVASCDQFLAKADKVARMTFGV